MSSTEDLASVFPTNMLEVPEVREEMQNAWDEYTVLNAVAGADGL